MCGAACSPDASKLIIVYKNPNIHSGWSKSVILYSAVVVAVVAPNRGTTAVIYGVLRKSLSTSEFVAVQAATPAACVLLIVVLLMRWVAKSVKLLHLGGVGLRPRGL